MQCYLWQLLLWAVLVESRVVVVVWGMYTLVEVTMKPPLSGPMAMEDAGSDAGRTESGDQ
jgi:hypothetical protein